MYNLSGINIVLKNTYFDFYQVEIRYNSKLKIVIIGKDRNVIDLLSQRHNYLHKKY